MTQIKLARRVVATAALALMAGSASAALGIASAYNGNVGLSVDGVGSNAAAVGSVQAEIPVGATILKAYLYSAGTPFPWYANSPTTLAAYNGAGITLAGTAITNFSTLVGATSTRADLGKFYTARADVTSLVQSLTAGAATTSFSWAVTEGNTLNNRIDGEVLAIVYSHASLPQGSVAFLDGGQNTGGETTTVNFSSALGDTTASGFTARFGIADSFSCCSQMSTITVNGSPLTTYAGNNDDGAQVADGSLITVGGLGDTPVNNPAGYESDHELYDLKPYLRTGDTSFSIFTSNATNDDNIFFAHLYVTANVGNINGTPVPGVPEPQTYAMMLLGLAGLGAASRRRKA